MRLCWHCVESWAIYAWVKIPQGYASRTAKERVEGSENREQEWWVGRSGTKGHFHCLTLPRWRSCFVIKQDNKNDDLGGKENFRYGNRNKGHSWYAIKGKQGSKMYTFVH